MNIVDKNYKFGIVRGTTVLLFNDTEHEEVVRGTDFLVDVNVELDDNGVLKIIANQIIYDFYSSNCFGRRIFEEDWIHTPHPKEIKEGKRHLWSGKKEKFVKRGWVRTTDLKPLKYVMTDYKVIIYE